MIRMPDNKIGCSEYGHRAQGGSCNGIYLFLLGCLFFGSVQATDIPIGKVEHLYDIKEWSTGKLALPTDVAVLADGRVCIVDSANHRVVVFSPIGDYLLDFGGVGTEKGQFKEPLGIGVDAKNNIYVADAGNNRIQVFDAKGQLKTSFPVKDRKGAVKPADVAVSADGKTIYVTGNSNHKLMLFDARGKLLDVWGEEGASLGEFRYPATLVVHENDIYIVDVLNSRVQIFDPKGAARHKIGEWGVLPGQLFRPKGVAVDNRGWFYVTDSYMDVVQVFDNGYKFEHVLGTDQESWKFTAPTGLAIGKDNTLYVSEILENKVSVFKLH